MYAFCFFNIAGHTKGTLYKPKPTRNQQFHTDGPLEYAAIWDNDSNLILTGDPNDFKDLPVPDPDTRPPLCNLQRACSPPIPGRKVHS